MAGILCAGKVARTERKPDQTGMIMPAQDTGALGDKEHRTISRVAAILESAASAPDGVTLTDMATLLRAPKSSIHGLLAGLMAVGYLTEHRGRYVTAPGLPALLTAAYVPSLEDLARPVMTRLRDAFDESVMLGVEAGDSIVYVDSLESRQPVRYSPPLRERRLLYPSSMGKLYLADLAPEQLDAYLRAHQVEPGRAGQLRRDLAAVQAEGVGYNREETFAGVTAAAAGIRDSDGVLAACISIAGPTARVEPRLADMAQSIRAAADEVSADFIRYESRRGRIPRRPSPTGLVSEAPRAAARSRP
jgi:DNA-binding IclR family transcriptional regulator